VPESRGTVVLSHGLGEHSGRYDHVARFFEECGYAVVRYDHYGHGRSAGGRGALESPRQLLDDLALVLDGVEGGGERILFGHSMGGAVAARFVAEEIRPVDRLILTSPALGTHIGKRDRLLVNLVHRLLPNLPRRNGLDASKISHDPAVVAAYRGDPLVHDRVTPRLVKFILDSGEIVLAHAAQWRVPTLLLWAGDDHLVRASGSERFASLAPKDVVTARGFPGLYHELLNEAEPARSEVFAAIGEWLRTS
jgi:alpha-beta hydrolase superfamily lysophospholipase